MHGKNIPAASIKAATGSVCALQLKHKIVALLPPVGSTAESCTVLMSALLGTQSEVAGA